MASAPATIEWFGATTYRIRARGLTIFLDTWLDRPSSLPHYLSASDVKDCDYIFISHAHFDHLPGADTIALNTGAKVIANGEAISVLSKLGVPASQLQPVSGGETIPLGDSGVTARVYPALHCVMPPIPHEALPEELDSGSEYVGGGGEGTMGVTKGMTMGFGRIIGGPDEAFKDAPEGFRGFRTWLKENRQRFSFFDGGQLMFTFEIPDEGNLLWSSHIGGYEGILKSVKPEKIDVAIMGIAGRPCHDGVPYDGSPAEFVAKSLQWLREPTRVVWCLQDDQPLKPVRILTEAAEKLVEEKTATRVWTLKHNERTDLFRKD